MKKLARRAWSAQLSADLYGINNWGAGYFGVSDKGEVTVAAETGDGSSVKVSMIDLVNEIKERGMDMPVLLRFENLLAQQIVKLNEAFNRAINQANYQAPYRGVFPVKVN